MILDRHMQKQGYDLFLIVPFYSGYAHRFYIHNKRRRFLVFSMPGNTDWPYGEFDLHITEKSDIRDFIDNGQKISNQRHLSRWMKQFEFSEGFENGLLPGIRKAL